MASMSSKSSAAGLGAAAFFFFLFFFFEPLAAKAEASKDGAPPPSSSSAAGASSSFSARESSAILSSASADLGSLSFLDLDFFFFAKTLRSTSPSPDSPASSALVGLSFLDFFFFLPVSNTDRSTPPSSFISSGISLGTACPAFHFLGRMAAFLDFSSSQPRSKVERTIPSLSTPLISHFSTLTLVPQATQPGLARATLLPFFTFFALVTIW